ncbi:Serine protease/ABC transporter B family protein tagD, partial [Tetrabaena socialis]
APLVIAQPADACTELTNAPADIRGAVVLVQRSGCLPYQKALAVVAAGGSAVIMMNNVPEMMTSAPDPVYPNSYIYAVRVAMSVIPQGVGQWLTANASAAGVVRLRLANLLMPVDINTVAAFSSYGPMSDGRIKPEVVAPGVNITSAGSNGVITGDACASTVITMTGTSMASPQAAGSAALVRQYLRTGFYPTGASTDTLAAPFTPSGMLIK